MAKTRNRDRRSFWLKHLHQWHWISAAVCLVGMLMFAATGITLNHASQIEAQARVTAAEGKLPAALLASVADGPRGNRPLPSALGEWLDAEFQVRAGARQAEWSEDEIYLSLPRPGGDTWISIDLATGDVLYERTDRGWLSYLNDLHKGRNTGLAWSWFIDIFAAGCLVFCVTGLILLQLHARRRPATWPMVGLGVAIPLVFAILFIH